MLDNTFQIRYKGISVTKLADSDADAVTFSTLRCMLYQAQPPNELSAEHQPHNILDEKHAVALCLQLPRTLRNDVWAPQSRLAVPVHGFTGSWKRAQPFRPQYPRRPRVHTSIYRDGPGQLPPGHALYKLRHKSQASIRASVTVALARKRLANAVPRLSPISSTARKRPHCNDSQLHHLLPVEHVQPQQDTSTIPRAPLPVLPCDTNTPESCFLIEKIGHYKTVQLRFSRRSLIRPAVVGCSTPIKLYSVAFGGCFQPPPSPPSR